MSRSCPPNLVILAVMMGENAPAGFEEHRRGCRRCSAITAAVRDAAASPLLDESADMETIIAGEIVARLEEEPAHRWPSIARGDLMFHAEFVGRHLLACADRFYGPDPRKGLAYVETALAVCELIPDPPAELYATALKEKSTYLRRSFRITEALATLDAADEVAARAEDAGYLVATLKLARAMILADPDVGQFDEALRLAAEARAGFAGRDRVRELRAARIGALVKLRRCAFAEARMEFEALLPFTLTAPAPPLDIATLYQAIARCAVELGDARSARIAAGLAREICIRLRDPAEVARCDWLEGRTDLLESACGPALARFAAAAVAFEQLGRWDLWVRVKLDSVEAMLATDSSADVTQTCEAIATTSTLLDQREPNRRRHCTAEALDFLRRHASQGALVVDTVAYVRAYLDAIAESPPVPFAAPVHRNIM